MTSSQNASTDALPDIDGDQTLQIPKEKPCFAWLVALNGPRRGRLYALRADGASVGRSSENDIIIDDEATSRHHARLYADDDLARPRFFVQDLASANGTFVNGERISRQALSDEDRIVFGETLFAFKQFQRQ
ncbi:MAG TPA: FHA domain-containing protein [Caldilineae bacterium]|nr:FHA domain-containing protein [Caldilineae bacterium]